MTADPVRLLADLDAVNRRIDNMRFLVTFQEEKRDRLLASIRRSIGRTAARTMDVDIDVPAASAKARKARACVACGKDMAHDREVHEARIAAAGAGRAHVVHVDDVALLDMGVLTLPRGSRDRGWATIDAGCAERLGGDWNRKQSPKVGG